MTATFKVNASIDASLLSGIITIDERLCKTPENNTNKYPTFVTNQKNKDTVNFVPDCTNSRLELEISTENTELIPANGSTTVVDYSNEFVYGLAEDLTLDSFKASYAAVLGTGTIECADSVLKTGSVIKLMKDGVCKAQYTVVIYGDLNSDAKANGEDAFIVNMVAKGIITADSLTEAQRRAADPNHDGVINADDVALLSNAGLLKETVSQF